MLGTIYYFKVLKIIYFFKQFYKLPQYNIAFKSVIRECNYFAYTDRRISEGKE